MRTFFLSPDNLMGNLSGHWSRAGKYALTLCSLLLITQSNLSAQTPDPGFTATASIYCGRLILETIPNESGCKHTWDITIGNVTENRITATVSLPLDNINTYPAGGTPTSVVNHSVTCNGIMATSSQTITLPSGIFIGTDATGNFLLSAATSAYNGQSLLPFNALTQTYSISNSNLYINCNFQIDQSDNNGVSGLVVNACTVEMAPCGGVEIMSHPTSRRTLEINNGTVIRGPIDDGCTNWKGISVRNNTVISFKDSEIRDAYFAINTNTSQELIAGNAPMLDISNSVFFRNFIGINLLGTAAQPSVPLIKNFAGNTFIGGDEFLKRPCAGIFQFYSQNSPTDMPLFNGDLGFAGLYMRNGVFRMPATSNFNLFTELANGAIFEDSNIPADNPLVACRFTNILQGDDYGAAPNGNGIYFYDRSGSADFWHQSNLASDPSVDDFFNCPVAIRAVARIGSHINSVHNTMSTVGTGYNLRAIGGSFGLHNGQRSTLNQNRITANLTTPVANAFVRPRGIEYNHSSFNITRLDIFNQEIILEDGDSPLGEGRGMLFTHQAGLAFPPHDIEVAGCLITVSQRGSGIEAINMKQMRINTNILTIPSLPSNNPNIIPNRGIVLTGCFNTILTGCMVERNSGALAVNEVTDAYFVMDGAQNFISGNRSSNTGFGFRFAGFTPATIQCNIMEDHRVGLFYNITAVTGDQTARRNCWLGTYASGFMAINQNLNPSSSRYFIPINSFSCEVPPAGVILPMSGWFIFTSGTPSLVCSFAEPAFYLTELDTAIASGAYIPDQLINANLWWARRYLYDKLRTFPALQTGNALMQNFASSFVSSSVGMLTGISFDESSELVMSVPELQIWNDNNAAIAANIHQISTLDALLISGGTQQQMTQWWSERAVLITQLAQLLTLGLQLELQFQQTLPAKANLLAIENAGVTSEGSYDDNEKLLHAIWLATEAQGLPVGVSDINTIRAIGEMCRESGGPSIYWARAWHLNLTGQMLYGPETCFSQRTNQRNQNLEISATIAPNPASSLLVIAAQDEKFEPGTKLRLVNSSGVLLASMDVSSDAEKVEIPVDAFPSGVYFIVIVENDRIPFVEKVVILHP